MTPTAPDGGVLRGDYSRILVELREVRVVQADGSKQVLARFQPAAILDLLQLDSANSQGMILAAGQLPEGPITGVELALGPEALLEARSGSQERIRFADSMLAGGLAVLSAAASTGPDGRIELSANVNAWSVAGGRLNATLAPFAMSTSGWSGPRFWLLAEGFTPTSRGIRLAGSAAELSVFPDSQVVGGSLESAQAAVLEIGSDRRVVQGAVRARGMQARGGLLRVTSVSPGAIAGSVEQALGALPASSAVNLALPSTASCLSKGGLTITPAALVQGLRPGMTLVATWSEAGEIDWLWMQDELAPGSTASTVTGSALIVDAVNQRIRAFVTSQEGAPIDSSLLLTVEFSSGCRFLSPQGAPISRSGFFQTAARRVIRLEGSLLPSGVLSATLARYLEPGGEIPGAVVGPSLLPDDDGNYGLTVEWTELPGIEAGSNLLVTPAAGLRLFLASGQPASQEEFWAAMNLDNRILFVVQPLTPGSAVGLAAIPIGAP